MGAAWMLYGPVAHPVEFGPGVASPAAVPQGGVVHVTREFIVRQPVVVTVQRNLQGVDKAVSYAMPESVTHWNPGRYANPRAFAIPEFLPPGHYMMESVATWKVNPLRTHSEPIQPVPIEVIPR